MSAIWWLEIGAAGDKAGLVLFSKRLASMIKF